MIVTTAGTEQRALVVTPADDGGFIVEIIPRHARRRCEVALADLDAACRRARATGQAEITLTWRSPDE